MTNTKRVEIWCGKGKVAEEFRFAQNRFSGRKGNTFATVAFCGVLLKYFAYCRRGILIIPRF